MAVRFRSLWVFNAACTVALLVAPALAQPAPEPPTKDPISALVAQHCMAPHAGAFGTDMLTVLTHSLRAADTARRDRPGDDGPLHLSSLLSLLLAAPALAMGCVIARRVARQNLALAPFCGHGPPSMALPC